ncbi:MAG: IS4 family transposase [Planctomycetes bacterium]|nr:IS4 family transposase [Planctomycetota bacterium]
MLPTIFGSSLAQVKGTTLHVVLRRFDAWLGDAKRRDLAKPKSFVRSGRPYSLRATLLLFLSQCLGDDKSCRTAVARGKSEGILPADTSPKTSAYCRARDGLCDVALKKEVEAMGDAIDAQARPEDLWCNRPVKVLDGSGISMPDTPENQEAYPQPSTQAPGCGFPMLYLVAVMSLATGVVLRYVADRLGFHEQNLLHRLHPALQRGDVALGDRGFCSFGTMALLLKAGVDSVFRIHQRRKTDFRKGRRLGPRDHVVEWVRSSWPQWLSRDAELPLLLKVRELYVEIKVRGFRTRYVTLATTLLDSREYPAESLAEPYLRRWSMELWLRHVKITLGMDILRTQTPERIRAELAMSIIGYNLVRAVMLDAAHTKHVPLDRVSFKSALSRVRLWCHRHIEGLDVNAWLSHYPSLLDDLARDLPPLRPNRVEPRAKKRRPKEYDLLNRPRAEMRAQLLNA